MMPQMRIFTFAILLFALVGLFQPVAAQEEAGPELKSLIGRVYEGSLPMNGWEDMGGGHLANSVWFHHFRRADGVQLVMVDWIQPRRAGSQQATFRVTDVLFVPALQENQSIIFDCQGRDRNVTRKIIAVAQVDPQNQSEWWSDIRQAWSVSLDDGRVTPTSPEGVKCINESWGD